MRLLILSFFAVLLGYSLLFDQREETKLIKRPQEVSPSSAVMAPNASDSISYSYMNCCLLYTSPSPRDFASSRMPSSA